MCFRCKENMLFTRNTFQNRMKLTRIQKALGAWVSNLILYLRHSYTILTQKSVCSWFSFVSFWPFARKRHRIAVQWSRSYVSGHGDLFRCVCAVLSATDIKMSHTWNEIQSQVDAWKSFLSKAEAVFLSGSKRAGHLMMTRCFQLILASNTNEMKLILSM